jgi:microcystin-dependent protein
MADPFVAEIRMFPFNFAPRGWAFCDGQILPISQNTALFSLLGTTYGGDGNSNFALPDLLGRAPMHPGQGQGLSLRDLGETGGNESVTLLESEIPLHNHQIAVNVIDGPAESNNPEGKVLGFSNRPLYATVLSSSTAMSLSTLATAGGSIPHNNMMPYLAVNFCIALQGVFPPRT